MKKKRINSLAAKIGCCSLSVVLALGLVPALSIAGETAKTVDPFESVTDQTVETTAAAQAAQAAANQSQSQQQGADQAESSATTNNSTLEGEAAQAAQTTATEAAPVALNSAQATSAPASATEESAVSQLAETAQTTITLDFSGIDTSLGIGAVEVDGTSYALNGNQVTVPLPESAAQAASFITFYTYKQSGGTQVEGNYPTNMYVWSLSFDGTQYTAQRQSGLDNALTYAGCSIRISSNSDTASGVRIVTSVSKSLKSNLTASSVNGYTLQEYGTVVKWDGVLGSTGLTLDTGVSSAAYVKGASDAVYKETDSLVKYTAVLTNFSGSQITDDLRVRPYMKLVDANGKECVLYGGNLVRSVGYVASQNSGAFDRGTAGYRYVWNLIHAKYGTSKDGALNYQAGTVCDYVESGYMCQNPDLPWGCESVSLGIVLRALGYNVSVTEVWDSYLTHSDWDFVNAFCGDARYGTGIAETYPPAIVDAANRYLVQHNSKARAYNLSGASFGTLLDYVNQGYPVLVWTTINMGYVGKMGWWQQGYEAYANEHCVVMYGASGGGINVADPISGVVVRDWGAFESLYNQCGCYAAVIV